MTLSSHHAELAKMIKGFRVSDLQTLLIYGGKNKAGKKSELQARALDLIKIQGPHMTSLEMKIRELYRNRYQQSHGHVDPPEMFSDMYTHGLSDPIGNNYSNISSHKSPLGPPPGIPNYVQTLNHQMMRSVPALNVMPQYPVNPDVQFKELPFYDVLNDILKPTSLVPPYRNDGLLVQKDLIFNLGPQDLRELESNTDVQVQFRIGCLENNREQDDEFPSQAAIYVNHTPANLPTAIATNKPGMEPKRPKRPVDITSLVKRTASESQVVTVAWSATTNKPFVSAVFLVRKQSSSVLIKRLKDIGVRNPDHTTAMIKEKLCHDRDSEIATMSLRGSLICPLGKIKMTLPCRALTCTHLQCFDAALYVQMNEKKPKWICPVCDKIALFKTLAIDGLFLDITRKAPSECTEVQFHENGSWTPVITVKKLPEISDVAVQKVVPVVPKVETPPKPKKSSIEVVDLDSDSDTQDSWPVQPPKKKVCNKPVGIINPVVLDNLENGSSDTTAKSYDTLQSLPSKSILSTSKMSALPADRSLPSQNSMFPFLSSSKDFESSICTSQSPPPQSSSDSTFQETVDILNSPSGIAGHNTNFKNFDLMSLFRPSGGDDVFPNQDPSSEDTTNVADEDNDPPDIISID